MKKAQDKAEAVSKWLGIDGAITVSADGEVNIWIDKGELLDALYEKAKREN